MKKIELFSPLVRSAVVVDMGAILIATAIAVNWASASTTVIEYGFSRSYQSAAGVAFGGGITAILFGGIMFSVFLFAHLANVDLWG